MNTQVSYFKKALVVLMAVIMVFTYMPSMAWAADGDGSGTTETPKSCLIFTTDLDDSEVHFCPNSNSDQSKSYVEIIEAKVTQYYDAEGNPRELPEGTKVTYKWYQNGKSNISLPGKAWQSVIQLNQKRTTATYYATASATIDGTVYTGTSKTLSARLGIAPIQASITVNQKGILASTSEGKVAANLPLTVVDLDGDDKFSLDEALKAAHKAYKTEADYEAAQSGAYFTVSKLWGEPTSNLLFFVNGTAGSSVNETYLEANDQIYASINKDDKYYSDVYCKFDVAEKTVLPKREFTLTLTDGSGRALSGVQIGTWENGSFQALEGKTTDENGSVSLVFPAGEYVVTAQGTSKGTVQDWSSESPVDVSDFDRPLMAPVCTITSAMPSGDCGASNNKSNVKWKFDVDTKTLTISGTGATASSSSDKEIKMPWKAYVEEIEEVVIGEGITELRAKFGDCPKLTSIIFEGESKAVICTAAFANCTALKEITLPAGTTCEGVAFAGCTGLKKATIGSVRYGGTFAGCSSLEEVIYQEGVTSFGDSTFCKTGTYQDCTSLKKVYIPSTLTEWGETPFPDEIVKKIEFSGPGTANFSFEKDGSVYNKDKTVLYYVSPSTKTIVIPASVTSLNPSLFAGFTKLTKVTFQEGSKITAIPESCFANCTALKEITLPGTVESIGYNAFFGCTALQKINLSSSLKSIGSSAFSSCTALESIELPNGLQEIAWYAFQDCEKLKELKLPETLTDLGAQAIKGTSIEEIILPPSITKLNENQFKSCNSLKRIEVQGNVTTLPQDAFVPCSGLESLFLPKSVNNIKLTSINGNVFGDNYVIYYAGTTANWKKVDPTGTRSKSTVICNYVKPTTEEGKMEVASLPSDIITDDAASLKTQALTLALKYSEGTTASTGDKITADWYYTTKTPDGLKGLKIVSPCLFRNNTSMAALSQQATAAKPGTWYYICVVFKTTADDQTTMLVTDPVKVTVKDSSFTLDGLGTKDDPYKITSYDDLKLIAEKVAGGESFSNTYFALKTDEIVIETDWQQIGTKETPFMGIFDGENHILTYAKGAKSLFGTVGSTTVQNLRLKGEYIDSCGLATSFGANQGSGGGKSGNLINCKLLSGSKTRSVGLVGDSGGINITNCEVESGVKIGLDENGDVVGKGALGSIVGAGAFVLVGCKSGADIYSTGCYVGGLAGIKGYAMRACTIKNSQFTGSIHADDEYIGGILGAGYDDQTAPNTLCAVIENCYVNADITGAQAVGGIFGGEGGCDQAWDNGIGYIRNNVFYGALHINGKEVPPKSTTESGGQAMPAANIGGSKGAVSGFMRSLNKNNVIENNYYFITNGEKEKGIGAVEHIDTSKIRPMGMHDGVYYYDTSRDSTKDICDWVDREDGPNRSDSSVTKTGMNRTDDPLGEDKDKLAKACTQKEMTDGSIVRLLNAHASSMHNWEQGENCPVLSDKAVAYKIEVGGTYKNEYYIGNKLDLSGIEFTVTWSDGTTTNPTLENGVKVTGFDSSKQAIVHLTATYDNAACDFTVKIKKRADGTAANPDKIKVNFKLLGDSFHGEEGEKHTLKNDGLTEWLPNKEYQADLNATVWDFLKDVVEKEAATPVTFNAKDTQYGKYIYSVTYNNDLELAEFDNGNLSGWMYTLNDKHPLLAVNEQFLKDGDTIVFHYTDDYTVEQGSEDWNTPGGGVIEEVKNVTTDTKTGTTTAPTEVKVSEKTNADGTKTKVADVKVSADNQKEILKQAKASKSKEIILNVSSKSVGDAAKADVTLDKSFIDSIVKETDAKLTIKTPFGDKTYTQDELKAMSEAVTGSTVTVAIEKATEEPTDDAAAKIEKAKSIVKDLKLVARSSKTAKKNIKAVLKNNAKTKASIQELKDLGFTVKYRFYRSTKKAASYKSTVTKKTAAYTNTSGKKGTKYFYKVQVRVYDENGKLVAKTALKQCKYASRTWSKAR